MVVNQQITLEKPTLANYINKSSLFLYISKYLKHLIMIYVYECTIYVENLRDDGRQALFMERMW